jgi:hypothetical protein
MMTGLATPMLLRVGLVKNIRGKGTLWRKQSERKLSKNYGTTC